VLNNVIDDDANAPSWTPWDYDTDAGLAGGLAKVEVSTVGVSSANLLLSGESGLIITNAGTTVKNYHVLPPAAAGLTFTFVNDDADGIYVGANTSDTIRIEGSVSAASGNIQTSVVGGYVTLVAIDTTQWIATAGNSYNWSVT
jgi:hypothetical protein